MSKVTDVRKKRRRVCSMAGTASRTRQRSSLLQVIYKQPFNWSGLRGNKHEDMKSSTKTHLQIPIEKHCTF